MEVEDISNRQWEKIVTRPFSLSGSSVWNEWYNAKTTKDIFGVTIPSGLFIEYPKGTVRHYRDKAEIANAKKALQICVKENPQRYENLLKDGKLLNKKAKQVLKKNDFKSIKEAVEFLTRLALFSTVLPYWLGDLAESKFSVNKRILSLSIALRGASLYPRIVKQVIELLVKEELKRLGINEPAGFELVTYNEITGQDRENIKNRISERLIEVRKEKNFIYQNLDGKESVIWVENPEEIIKETESVAKSEVMEIKGNSAYPGKVTGRARLVFTDDVGKLDFNKEDIVVAPSTNPNLMSLLKKAGAIITDEGGITCHAAIISRELKKPCVIGTRIATQVLRDGDLVEVDAERGMVRRISG